MSAQSAFNARRIVENAMTTVAIELLCGTQAMEFVEKGLDPGVGTTAAYEAIREEVPPLREDRPLAREIETVTSGRFETRVERALDGRLE